ncbi:MAG: Na/Pi cotransporter family protein [Clostridia bacterium]
MNIFMIISLFGGLALFLFGMDVLGNGLEKFSGGKAEKTLEKLTNNIFKSVLLGALVTAAVQSSSATTVIVVGLVNARILKLRSAIGVIMGANIGTTITGQILRLNELNSSGADLNIFLQFLKPTTLAPLIAIFGIILVFVPKKTKYKNIGYIMLGFGVLFNGMFAMEAAVRPLAEIPAFQNLFVALTNPVLGVAVGAIVTAIIQSSSASIGILQAISATGVVTSAAAFPIIMGQNIGTCITPILASIGASKNAKRTALVHLCFNIIGTIVFLSAVYLLQYLIGFSFWNEPITMGGIANFHTLFNVVITILFIPFAGLLEKLVKFLIRNNGKYDDADEDEDTITLDDRLLVSPSLALTHCEELVSKMGKNVHKNGRDLEILLDNYDPKLAAKIHEREDSLDRLEDKLGNYLVKLTDREVSDEDGRTVTCLLHLISEFERTGDYIIEMLYSVESMHEDGLKFSDKAYKEIKVLLNAINEIITLTYEAYSENDITKAESVEPLEQTIDLMVELLKAKHIMRLKEGKCSVDIGMKFLEILNNAEGISDHCSNIAVYYVGYKAVKNVVNPHEYLRELHKGNSAHYISLFDGYKSKYLEIIQ